jgi:anti-sigma factor RsiW
VVREEEMDRRVKEGLEEYLHGAMEPARKADFERMLNASDESTRQIVAMIERQSAMLRNAFRPAEDSSQVEAGLRPGFYGRVMERIQVQRSTSIWSAFLEPQFFRRVAFASATLLFLLSVTMFTGTSAEDESLAAASVTPVMQTIAQDEDEQPLGESQEEDRDVILVNLATYQQE